MESKRVKVKYVFLIVLILSPFLIIAQPPPPPPPPPPPAGVPIDGLSGIIIMAIGALIGKRFVHKK